MLNFKVPKPRNGVSLRLPVSGYRHPVRTLLVYVLVEERSVRIFLPGEVYPHRMKPFLRPVHLHVHQPAQHDGQGKQASPKLFGFHPFPGVLLLIEPDKPTFLIRDAQGEREVQRDERKFLVL